MQSSLIELLQTCGHILHYGDLDSEDALSALSQEEQAELSRMLGILLQDCETHIFEMPEHWHKHH